VTAAYEPTRRVGLLPGPFPAFVVGAVALVVCAVYGFFQPESFFRAYLIAYFFWVGVSLGSLALVQISPLTGGHWGDYIRPVLAPATRTLPLLAVLFLPLLFGLTKLYPWAMPDELAHDPMLLMTTKYYLNVPSFLVRAALYFLIWLGTVSIVMGWRGAPLASAATENERRRYRAFCAVGLVCYGLTTTFSAIDWAMSLEPKWFSTIYGAMIGTGQLLSAFSFAVVVIAWSHSADRPILRDLGNLLLTFTMVWTYMAFSQFLLIWAGNLREEIPWYLRRGDGVWPGMAAFIFVLQFAVPFALLLSRTIKENPRTLLAVAGLAFAVRLVNDFWLIAPAFPDNGDLFFLQPIAYLGIGGLWLGTYLWLGPQAMPAVVPASSDVGEPTT
jgi:hypothetical protein